MEINTNPHDGIKIQVADPKTTEWCRDLQEKKFQRQTEEGDRLRTRRQAQSTLDLKPQNK